MRFTGQLELFALRSETDYYDGPSRSALCVSASNARKHHLYEDLLNPTS